MEFGSSHCVTPLLRAMALAACCSIAGCGGGGGGSSPSVMFSFTQSSGTLAEGGAPLTLTVVLHTTLASLPGAASVDVVDAGSGTATSGADYAAFAPVTLSFPIGALDGDTQQIDFSAIDDHSIEGADESVMFALANPVGGSPVGVRNLLATIDDIHVASLEFSASSSSTPDESSAPRSVTVRLDLPLATTLDVAASVRLSDAGGGSASSSLDYAAFAPATLSFAAGSSDGATQNFSVQVIDDSAVEADEIVRLALSNPAAGSAVGALALHQLTITDDDASGNAALVATEGPSGIENGLAYNTLIDLGSQTVGAGSNAGTLVRITNAGGSAMDLGAPRLSGTHPNDFDVVVESAPLTAPPAFGEAGFVLAPDVPAPWLKLEGPGGLGVQLALDRERIAALGGLVRATIAGFPVPGAGEVTLDLHRLPLPIASGAVLRVDGVDVPGGLAGAVGDLSAWGGSALELPGSRVFLALSSQGMRGYLELDAATDRFVHVLTERGPGPGGAPALSRVVRGPELAAMGVEDPAIFCGGERQVPGVNPRLELGAMPPAPPPDPLTPADCKIAIETDYQFYQKFGSTLTASLYVTQLMSAVSDQYFTDVQTTLSIAYLGLYSSPADPWLSQDSGGDAGDLLDEFRAAWIGGGWPASANLAHFISGANLGGGIAYVNVLCSQSFGFGVSGNISGNIVWGTWTGAPANFTWDFVVVAHELGHNFGSSHTHSYCPPLDLCYANCSVPPACSQGTIMSYCHTCGGMDNIDLEFHPVCANIMRTAVNSSCLGLSALAPGDHVQYQVRFNPLSATGLRSANLEFSHDAPNQPQPFRLRLQGTGN